jgi:glycerol uptake facilitator-like aquaporin
VKHQLSLGRRAAAEGLGTAFLLVAVVGSGIMAERLAGGNVALALLANAIATGAALFALILVFAPWSGAHFNPVVTLALLSDHEVRLRDALAYVAAQILGAIAGVWIAHSMFELPILEWSAHARTGLGQSVGEVVATFGLLLVIESGRRNFAEYLPAAIAAYITAAYWFTSSTSFANPAVTLARALTDSFAGIAANNVLGFVLCQCAGASLAVGFVRWIDRRVPTTTSAREVPATKFVASDEQSAM